MPDIRLLMTADAAGGIWTYALETAQALSARGISTTLAVLGDDPSEAALREARSIAGVEIELTGLPLDWTAASASEVTHAGEEIARLSRRTGAGLVQLNAPAFAADASFAVPTIGALHSCVATWWEAVHGNVPLPPDLDWRAKLTCAGLNRVDFAIAPSQTLARQARRLYALPRAPMVIHNGRSSSDSAPSPTRDIPVLTAGRLWDQGKNIAALDRAAEHVSFKVGAAGPLQGPNGAEARLNRVEWLGVLAPAALRDAMSRSSIFVSAALYEPFGLAVLEAAQAGCALVLSDIPTFRELWQGAALLVPPSDARAIAGALNKITGDAALRGRLSDAARQRAASYTIDKSADALAALMRSLVAEPQRRAS
ncbi:MAG: phosphatidyl-myo-inositol alpha-mannosyltransferase [Methylobacteriaceae bacterium]|jgi:glycosyltransferase involved in cell wall biosynthesis|nr:phosphatidyl-myo-inositol alpha-mannosyltransferase [Methylobacteriaceae bacterium]